MNSNFNLIAGAILSSVVSLSAFAQSVVISRPPVSNAYAAAVASVDVIAATDR